MQSATTFSLKAEQIGIGLEVVKPAVILRERLDNHCSPVGLKTLSLQNRSSSSMKKLVTQFVGWRCTHSKKITDEVHPLNFIHLHGHHFFEVAQNGALGDLRDTTLVGAGESRDIICVFDNPGKWLLHCHMLSHAFGGMRTWVNVA